MNAPALFCGVSKLSWFDPAMACLVIGRFCSAEDGDDDAI